jgi:hypothetical protein
MFPQWRIFRLWPSVLWHRAVWQIVGKCQQSILPHSSENKCYLNLEKACCSEVLVLQHIQSRLKTERYKEQLENCLKKLMAMVWELRPFSLIGYWKRSRVHSTDSIGRVLKTIREAPDKMCQYFTHTTLFLPTQTDCFLFVYFPFSYNLLYKSWYSNLQTFTSTFYEE